MRGEGSRLGPVKDVATGTKYCFICTQSKKTRSGKKYDPRGFFGRNLLEIVDDNATSCVYISEGIDFLKHYYQR